MFFEIRYFPFIRPLRSKSTPLLVMTFLAIPAFSAWTWNRAERDRSAAPAPTPINQRLPVEIIPYDDKPQWVLVPIDPG